MCLGLAHVHGTIVSPTRAPAGDTDTQHDFDDSSSLSGDTNTNTESDVTTWVIPEPEAEPQHASDAHPSANETRHRQSVGTRRLQGKLSRNRTPPPPSPSSDHVFPSLARPHARTHIPVIVLLRILGGATPRRGLAASCEDSAQYKAKCGRWKAAGYCTPGHTYYAFMKKYCAKTCGFCKSGVQHESLSHTPPPPSPSSDHATSPTVSLCKDYPTPIDPTV